MVGDRFGRVAVSLLVLWAGAACSEADGGEDMDPGHMPVAGSGGVGEAGSGVGQAGSISAGEGGSSAGSEAPPAGSGGGGDGGSGAGTGVEAGTGGGAPGGDGGSDAPPDAGAAPDSSVPPITGNFSFFVTSIEAMRELSGSPDGFGGNLGGLTGADSICQRTAAKEGAGHKTWRAFLSARAGGPGGGPVHAIDRIGDGPWYDRNGRLVAMDKAGLVSGARPAGDRAVVSNLPNERGEPLNQNGADDHDVLTGSDSQGRLHSSTNPNATCNDWTTTDTVPSMGTTGGMGGFGGFGGGFFGGNGPMLGHSWPAMSGQGWIQAHGAPGCAAGVNLVQSGPPPPGSTCVGCGGGYGAIYCFALTP